MGKQGKKVGASTRNFSALTKKDLANLVREFPCIWDIGNADHQNSAAQQSAWSTIAGHLQEAEADCKRVWKSMRGSLRYHNKSKKPRGKSGEEADAEGSQFFEEEFTADDDWNTDWEFWEAMKFLVETKAKRTTLSGMIGSNLTPPSTPATQEYIDVDDQRLETYNQPIASGSMSSTDTNSTSKDDLTRTPHIISRGSYSFASKKRKQDPSEKLAESLSGYFDYRKKKLDSTPPEPDPTTELRYKSMYVNLDRMWNKLPESVVEDLNMQVLSATHHALKQYESATIVQVQEYSQI